ncbi:MAG: hypothetical protein J7647_15065 [Cyanobacteria bacterium SBLK]|nr:hypothetical protein [Cyanobacteria bacterium SBLK]
MTLPKLRLAVLGVGGSGKTTITTHSAYWLAKTGFSTVWFDFDVFPVLSYFEDIRHAIREGLGIANAKLLQKLSPKNLNLTETKARNIRKNLCDRVLKEKLTKEKTKALVNETLAKHNPKDEEKITARQTAKTVKSIESIAVDEMNSEQLQAIREAMQAKLAQIDAQLT